MSNKRTSKKAKLPRRTKLILLLLVLICIAVLLNYPFHYFMHQTADFNIIKNGSFTVENNSDPNEESDFENLSSNPLAIPANEFKKINVNSSDVANGDLILVNKDHPFTGSTQNFTSFEDDSNLNHCFYVSTYRMQFQKEISSHLKDLTHDYISNFEKADIFIANTTNTQTLNQYCQDVIPERDSGYCIDFILRLKNGTKQAFGGNKNSEWISENAWKYGFIQRYTEDKSDKTGMGEINYHFRYVGVFNAAYMHDNNLCLEEYLDMIRPYSYEDPLICQYNEKNYEIYFTAESNTDITEVMVPKGYSNSDYVISGNNTDGFITVVAIK